MSPFPWKNLGALSTFYINLAEKVPGHLGDYIPSEEVEFCSWILLGVTGSPKAALIVRPRAALPNKGTL